MSDTHSSRSCFTCVSTHFLTPQAWRPKEVLERQGNLQRLKKDQIANLTTTFVYRFPTSPKDICRGSRASCQGRKGNLLYLFLMLAKAVKGSIRILQSNYRVGFISGGPNGRDLCLPSFEARNRALDGDIVIAAFSPRSEWTVVDASAMKEGQKLCKYFCCSFVSCSFQAYFRSP